MTSFVRLYRVVKGLCVIGVAGAHDQCTVQPVSGQQRFANCFGEYQTNRKIFAVKQNCPMKIGQRPLQVTLTRLRKAGTLL